MNYSIYVAVETLQKMAQLSKQAFVCDGDKRMVMPEEEDEE